MIPGGSITNRSELGVNIQKNPGLIQKKRSGNIPKRTIRLLPTPLPDRSPPLPFHPPCLRTAHGFGRLFGEMPPFIAPYSGPPRSGPVPGFGRLFGEMPPFIAPYSCPHTPARLPALGGFSEMPPSITPPPVPQLRPIPAAGKTLPFAPHPPRSGPTVRPAADSAAGWPAASPHRESTDSRDSA